ncbi:MAG: FAD-binding oxidoreductase [Legionellales bacterium]|jgi:FAD/FMN-containing dehydrogenase
MSKTQLMSWGRYPQHPQIAQTVAWRSDLSATMDQLKQTYGSTLAFGNGRSYGDSCLAASGHVLQTTFLNRFVSADWQTGIIQAESGITLQEILQVAIPNGWFLPVTPGTQYVTLGGALANDVHGKNHHVRGTFGCHVRKFNLVRSDQAEITCSPSENSELFAATIGGLGLTGIIAWVELQLMPIQSSMIQTTTIRFNSLEEFFSLSQELDAQHEYSVAWVDCVAKDQTLGRGIFIVGNHAHTGELTVSKARKISIPLTPPISMINQLTLRAFNKAYYHAHASIRKEKNIAYESFFYPLDRILNWNRLYGCKGFQQYQCVIPEKNAKAAIHELLTVIAKSNQGSFLAVLKRCGAPISPGLMSFPMPGVSLALDFPQNNHLENLFACLDAIVRENQGRLYPAKDAHMSGEDFRRFYPQWEKVAMLQDPSLDSLFWRRVILS